MLTGCDIGFDREPDEAEPPLSLPACASQAGGCSPEDGVFPLSGALPSLAPFDLLPVAAALANAQVLGLGESAHMSRGFIGLKVRLSRLLIEQHGFRAIAWESPRVTTRRLDAFVRTCSGDASEATRALGPIWADTQTRDFALWLCAWNQEHPTDVVQVHGFDVQDLASDEAELRAFITELLPSIANELLESLNACDRLDYAHCKSALAATSAELLEAGLRAPEGTPRSRFAEARIALTSYQGGVDQFYIASAERAFEARDLAMAAVFQQLRERYFPDKKALIWAHNIHVVKQHQSVVGSWTGGAIITQGTQLERELAAGAYRAAAIIARTVAVNRPEQHGPVTPSPRTGSLEAVLDQLGSTALFLDLQQGHAQAVLPADQVVELGAPGVERLVPERCFDGVLFLPQSAMAEAL